MVYGCDGCGCALPARATVCPRCRITFDEAVPLDAVLPKSGFHAFAPAELGADSQNPLWEELKQEEPKVNLAQMEADIAALRNQAIALKSEVMTLRGYVSTLTDENAVLEDHSAALQSQSAFLQSQLTTLANRLTVLEMAGREDKRRFMDHVQHVKEALGDIQINGMTGAAGQ